MEELELEIQEIIKEAKKTGGVIAEDVLGEKLINFELTANDLKAINDKDTERVAPEQIEIKDDECIILKKHSWNMLRYKINVYDQ